VSLWIWSFHETWPREARRLHPLSVGRWRGPDPRRADEAMANWSPIQPVGAARSTKTSSARNGRFGRATRANRREAAAVTPPRRGRVTPPRRGRVTPPPVPYPDLTPHCSRKSTARQFHVVWGVPFLTAANAHQPSRAAAALLFPLVTNDETPNAFPCHASHRSAEEALATARWESLLRRGIER